MAPVRFALIGCGKIAERLAMPQLTGCPDARVTALVDIRLPVAQRLADKFGVERKLIWTDWKRMLREADVDAVGICLPNYLHDDAVIACCEAGKHVIVEKPMATSLAEADAIIRAAKQAGVKLMVEQTQRFDPVHEAAKDLLDSGLLGTIQMLRGRIGNAGAEYWSDDSPWFTRQDQAGGGALIDVGVHAIDLVLWLSGKRVKRVCASGKTIEKPIKVEDNASCLLEFDDGTMGIIEASWTTRPYEVTTQFYAQRGTMRTELGFGVTHPVAVQFCQAHGNPNIPLGEDYYPKIPAASRHEGAYQHFTRCIQNDTTPFVTGEDGRASLEVILAAYESIRTGRWVTLPLPAGRYAGARRATGKRSAREAP